MEGFDCGEMTTIASVASSDFVGVILAATPGARLFPLTVADDHEDDDDDDADGNLDSEKQQQQQQQQPSSSSSSSSLNEGLYKHLLPVMGIPIVCHLVNNLWESGLDHVVIAINHNDEVTVPIMMESFETNDDEGTLIQLEEGTNNKAVLCYKKTLKISIVSLPSTCAGSAEALVHIISKQQTVVVNDSPLLVMPGDLLLEPSSNVLGKLAHAHRKGLPTTAATVLLTDVGEEDENGIPLKESSKAKKGGIAREDEDIEFIGLSNTTTTTNDYYGSNRSDVVHNRIMLKQSKYDVEEEVDNTGSTPKLAIPKHRFHSANISQLMIRMDWSDVHVYALSPWVIQLLAARPAMKEIQKELLPLLISRQFRSNGIASTFPKKKNAQKNKTDATQNGTNDDDDLLLLDQVIAGFEEKLCITTSPTPEEEDDDNHNDSKKNDPTKRIIPFSVSAQTLSRPESKLTLRACTIQSYLYACREMVQYAVKQVKPSTSNNNDNNTNNNKKGKGDDSSPKVLMNNSNMCFPKDVLRLDTKNNSIVLASGSSMGDKVLVKSSTIGRNVQLGNRCRLNNVVIMDNVIIGDNCILQNSICASGSKIGENCNLNDCQLGPGSFIWAGTKSKGESFMKE